MSMERTRALLKQGLAVTLAVVSIALPCAHADVVTDWNVQAGEFVTAAGLGTPPACRMMAISHTAAFEAANAITRSLPVGCHRSNRQSTRLVGRH